MTLLPRTRRGTWLLAAAIWLGGSFGIWQVLPDRPRFVIPADERVVPIKFANGGRVLLGRDIGTWRPPATPPGWAIEAPTVRPNGAYRVWDVVTGQLLARWPADGRNVTIADLSPDGTLATVTEDAPDGRRWDLIDLRTGDRVPLPCGPHGPDEFTADGRYLAYVSRNPTGGDGRTVWWDCRDNRMVGEFPGVELAAMAADGRWVSTPADAKANEAVTLTVREPVTGREISRFDWPGVPERGHVVFSPAGDDLLIKNARGHDIVEAASGRVVYRAPRDPLEAVVGHRLYYGTTEFVWPPGVPEVVAVEDAADTSLTRFDLLTGQVIEHRVFERKDRLAEFRLITPVPARGLFMIDRSSDGLTGFRKWFERVPYLSRWLQRRQPFLAAYDARTGQEAWRIWGDEPISVWPSPDGRTLVLQSTDGRLEVWDVPPRPSLTWLAAAAGVWGLPVAWFARRRCRRFTHEPPLEAGRE